MRSTVIPLEKEIFIDSSNTNYSPADRFVFTSCVLDSTVEDFIQWNMEMMLQRLAPLSLFRHHHHNNLPLAQGVYFLWMLDQRVLLVLEQSVFKALWRLHMSQTIRVSITVSWLRQLFLPTTNLFSTLLNRRWHKQQVSATPMLTEEIFDFAVPCNKGIVRLWHWWWCWLGQI